MICAHCYQEVKKDDPLHYRGWASGTEWFCTPLPRIVLPPLPIANDFRDHTGHVAPSYHDALKAWVQVATATKITEG